MKPSLVIYTHTDVSDIWPICFGQMKKYIKDYKVYVCVDAPNESIPKEYIQIIYDDANNYTERWVEILSKIEDNLLLFLHEDMFLIDFPKFDLIEKYAKYVNDKKVNTIKLIYAGDGGVNYKYDETLIQNGLAKFSIQPTIFRKETLQKIITDYPNQNIWQLEECITLDELDYMVKLGGEPKRGIYHYDSFVFPFLSSAITKGKWNMMEYEKELNTLFNIYNVNPFERGII
jgi:hypothetical protein